MLSKENMDEKLSTNDFVDAYNELYKHVINDLIKRNNLNNINVESLIKNVDNTLDYARLYIRETIYKYIDRGFDNNAMRIVCSHTIRYESERVIKSVETLKDTAIEITALAVAKLILFS